MLHVDHTQGSVEISQNSMKGLTKLWMTKILKSQKKSLKLMSKKTLTTD